MKTSNIFDAPEERTSNEIEGLEGSEEELDWGDEEDCGKTADELEEFSNKREATYVSTKE